MKTAVVITAMFVLGFATSLWLAPTKTVPWSIKYDGHRASDGWIADGGIGPKGIRPTTLEMASQHKETRLPFCPPFCVDQSSHPKKEL